MAKFVAKKHLVRTPTLLIGIGGIGGQIVAAVNEAMSDYDKSCIKMLVMDTDSNALDKFENTDIPYIQTSENMTVQSYLNANADYLKWFPTDLFINAKSLINGAGQIRSVSRLGALASKAAGRFSEIQLAVDSILHNQGDSLNRAVRVMIVGSVTGGTGSGLGIQLPFYIRKVLRESNVPNALIRGLFLMPSLTEDAQDTEAKKRAVNVNGYAFLKELNAFYRAQKVNHTDNILRIEEYIPGLTGDENTVSAAAAAAMIPYDFLYLVEKRSNQGIIGDMQEYIKRSSQIVMNQLFSPIAANGYSSEDNMITSIVPAGGMNRYCGAGISNAIYPKDDVVRYCTVRYAEQLISEYWLSIDDEFRKLDEHQRRLKKTNPSLLPLDKGETYCKIFDEMCDPTKHDVVSEVAELNNELSITMTDADGKTSTMPLVDSLMIDIEKFIDAEFAVAGLSAEAESCKMTVRPTSTPEDVEKNILEKMEKLRIFQENSKKKVSELITSTATAIMPSDLSLAKGYSRNAQYNIYVALEKKHPIIARYSMYALLKLLKNAKKSVDAKLNSQKVYISIFEKDYFEEGDKDERKESPKEALDKTKKGWLSRLSLYSAAYKNLVTTFIDDVAGEATHICEMAHFLLKSSVYRIIIERLEVMVGLYEEFFNELAEIMKDKKKEAERLEKGRGEGVNEVLAGDKYICSNAECKKYLYDVFMSKVTDKELQMSDDVKKDFFDKMFSEYEVMLVEKNSPSAIVTHISYRDLFEQGILTPITNQFANGGFKHLDMGILDAIYLQYQITHQDNTSEKDSVEFREYFHSICRNLTTLAEPYMLYDKQVAGYQSGGMISYSWGLNHSAIADFQLGDAKASDIDETKLGNLFGSTYKRPLVDDSFSPYSMVCYATIYDLRIENCISYKTNSHVERCYEERLNNLANRAHFVLNTNRDNELDIIHPHLNRYWHEHAYLPELMGYDDEKMCNDIRLAFVLALALDRCKYIDNSVECLKCWCFRDKKEGTANGRLVPICIDGEELKTKSIFALYKAFDRNRVIVRNILAFADAMKVESSNNCAFGGVTNEIVIKQPIVQGLIKTNSEIGGSIIDVIYELYKSSANRNENEKIILALENYIYEYCLHMMNGNDNKAKALCEEIKKEIGKASKCLKDTKISEFFKEDIAGFCS